MSNYKSLLQLDVIHLFLKNSYWAKNIPIDVIEKSDENSLCFGVYLNKTQIGYCRVISDYAKFAYLADVFIVEKQQGKEYSKELMKSVMSHPQLQRLRKFLLATADSHRLYKLFGFKELEKPYRMMEITVEDIYLKK